MGARLQFRLWLETISPLIHHHGGRVSQATLEVQKAIDKCVPGDYFPCGQHLCGRMSDIQQIEDRVTVYAEIVRRKENLVLLVGVRENFIFGHLTPVRRCHPERPMVI